MTQRQKAIRTTMYSVDEGSGQVVTHQLPWPKDSPKIEPLKARGFTFERPEDRKISPVVITPAEKVSGVVAEKLQVDTTHDKRVAALEKARAAKAAKKVA